jgi:hypothetical protein
MTSVAGKRELFGREFGPFVVQQYLRAGADGAIKDVSVHVAGGDQVHLGGQVVQPGQQSIARGVSHRLLLYGLVVSISGSGRMNGALDGTKITRIPGDSLEMYS